MARTIKLTSGSIFNGNPITFAVQPNVILGTDSDNNTVYPSFHRVIFEITCGMSGGSFETVKMSAPVEQEANTAVVNIDISSALRTFRDSYEYIPNAATFPLVKFNVKAYDEYMLNGEVHQTGIVYFPAENDFLCTIFGAFSDFDRFCANDTKSVTVLSRKPTSFPHIATIGEVLAYPLPYDTAQSLANSGSLVVPETKEETITKEGLQMVGGQSVFALPASEKQNRQVFRFINTFGVLESISVPKAYSKKLSVSSTPYTVARQETFSKFSRAIIRKTNNHESWMFNSDPLNEDWLSWYLHDFLMSEHIWMQVNDVWLPCTVTPEDDNTFFDCSNGEMLSVSFTAELDINGKPS